MAKVVRVGFVGTGGIANFHMNHLEKMDDVKVVAVCDVVEEKVKAASDRFSAPAFACHEEMLDKVPMDALYVCVPPFAHVGQEELAVKKGLAIFVEKPVHLDLAKAKRIASTIKRKKLVSAAGYQDRYLDIIDRLKAYLDGKDVGLMMGYWMGGMPGVAWWRVKAESGGQAVEQTTHIFDMARYLFGEVDAVQAAGRTGIMTHVPDYDVEDASAVTLYFKSGLVGTIFSACFLTVGNKSGIDMWCRDAYIEYCERTSLKIVEPSTTLEAKVANDYGFAEDRTFIDAVKKGNDSAVRSTYPDSVKSLAVCLAANEAMAGGGKVKVKA